MLKTLCEIPAPSGEEEKLKEFIISELKDSIDLYFEDSSSREFHSIDFDFAISL